MGQGGCSQVGWREYHSDKVWTFPGFTPGDYWLWNSRTSLRWFPCLECLWVCVREPGLIRGAHSLYPESLDLVLTLVRHPADSWNWSPPRPRSVCLRPPSQPAHTAGSTCHVNESVTVHYCTPQEPWGHGGICASGKAAGVGGVGGSPSRHITCWHLSAWQAFWSEAEWRGTRREGTASSRQSTGAVTTC